MTRQSFYTAQRPMRGNGFRQDRELIRAGHHSGIVSFVQEDAIVCMSAGGIRDRQYEHLGTADMAVAQMYRTLLKSAKQVAEGGKDRKSTRLNQSLMRISYAVFCLKKKKTT